MFRDHNITTPTNASFLGRKNLMYHRPVTCIKINLLCNSFPVCSYACSGIKDAREVFPARQQHDITTPCQHLDCNNIIYRDFEKVKPSDRRGESKQVLIIFLSVQRRRRRATSIIRNLTPHVL